MDTIKFITNAKGERDGILIDLKTLRSKKKGENALNELLEDLEDVIVAETRKNDKRIPYEEARKQIFGK
jgi:hypothetical protein